MLTNATLNGQAAPLVIKLGGKAIDEPDRSPALWAALCELHRARPGGIVLVHGGAHAVDRQLQRVGLNSERRDGIRITPPDHLEQIVGVLAGVVNKALVGCIQRQGVPAVGLCLGDGLAVRCETSRRFPFDPGCVGEVIGGDGRLLRTLLDAGFMPVVCSIGLDDRGGALNINADEAAAGIARIIKAAELILLTDVRGVLDRTGALYEQLTEPQIEASIASGEIHGGMIPKVRGAIEAAHVANVPVTIASWNGDDLHRLARGQRAGTRIWPAALAAAPLAPVPSGR
jgi:acetylglutamate kinase